MTRVLALLLGLVTLVAAALPAAAEPLPLSRFTAQPGPLRLTDAEKTLDLFVPVASTVSVTDAILSLDYLNSRALLAERSVLSVRLNEATLAQIPLDPAQPQGTARVRLPADLWRAGFNRLTLSVVQHYTDRCEDPEAPELWTEIDLVDSTLDATLDPQDDPYRIADLSGLFSPGLGGTDAVLMLTAPAADPAVTERALPQVAQALALRRDYAPLSISTGTAQPRPQTAEPAAPSPEAVFGEQPDQPLWRYDVDGAAVHVLAGTTAELAPLLADGRLDGIDGPHLAVDGSGGVARLIVTGPTPDDVIAAARDLGRIQDVLNPAADVTFRGIEGAAEPVAPGVRLKPEAAYTFSVLGADSRTFSGMGSHGMIVTLPVPPDFYTYEGAQAELLLDFGYGAGMGPGSIMNIMLNGEFIHGVVLNQPNGTAFRDYRISLPASLLQRGDNTLEFAVSLRPPLSVGECASVKGRHLMAQMQGSSTFRMPEGGSATVLPDLGLFSASGYPYVGGGEPGSTIYIPDEGLRGSALTLIGKIAQAANVPGTAWRVETGIPETVPGCAIVLAPASDLTSEIFGPWSVALGKVDRWPYPSLQALRQASTDDARSVARRVMDLLGLARDAEAAPAAAAAPSLRQEGSLGPLGVMTAFANPWSETPRPLTVISADDAATLAARVEDLTAPAVWGQLQGDLAVWTPEEDVHAVTVSEPIFVAEDDPWLLLRLVLSNNPMWWLGAAGAVLVLIVVSASVLLRRRAKRLAEEE